MYGLEAIVGGGRAPVKAVAENIWTNMEELINTKYIQ